MKINAIAIALLDIAAEYTQTYNRWYDLDHLPEHISKGDVLAGRRYVAPVGLRAAPAVNAGETTGGHPPYATMYCYGGPMDFMSQEARDGGAIKDRVITKAGRYWMGGKVPYMSNWHHVESRARRSIQVAEDAIAYLPHRGMILALGAAPSVARRDEASAWWRATQEIELLDLPGVLAVLEFRPTTDGVAEQLLHVVLCEDAVLDVMTRIEQFRLSQRLTGKYPAHKGAYEELALLPYDTIVPFRYDFEV
jgi:hypothetical protein